MVTYGFAPKHKVKSLTKLQFNFDGAILSESSCVRNLGFLLLTTDKSVPDMRTQKVTTKSLSFTL